MNQAIADTKQMNPMASRRDVVMPPAWMNGRTKT
jgi:hypothetical protein